VISRTALPGYSLVDIDKDFSSTLSDAGNTAESRLPAFLIPFRTGGFHLGNEFFRAFTACQVHMGRIPVLCSDFLLGQNR
jgi:hypothetical protein